MSHPSELAPPIPPALLAALGPARGLFWHPPPEFREALCAYVGELREAGLGPAQMLLVVKRALADVSPMLVERSVTWCIDAYYRPP